MKVKLLTFGIKWLDKLGNWLDDGKGYAYGYRIWGYADKLWALREKGIAIGVSRPKAF